MLPTDVNILEMHSLHVHFEGGGDVRRVQLVPVAVEAFGVGVGSAGDRGLPRRSCRENQDRGQTVSSHVPFIIYKELWPTERERDGLPYRSSCA